MIMWIEEVTVMSLFLGKGAESKGGDIVAGQRISKYGPNMTWLPEEDIRVGVTRRPRDQY
jgi:hypothetical protein